VPDNIDASNYILNRKINKLVVFNPGECFFLLFEATLKMYYYSIDECESRLYSHKFWSDAIASGLI